MFTTGVIRISTLLEGDFEEEHRFLILEVLDQLHQVLGDESVHCSMISDGT